MPRFDSSGRTVPTNRLKNNPATIKTLATLLILSVLLPGCGRESGPATDTHKISRYIFSEAALHKPVDLNFDGVENSSLEAELAVCSGLALYIERKDKNPTIEIIWAEPEIDNQLLQKLPLSYTESMHIEYVPVSIQYYYSPDKSRKKIHTSESDRVVIDKSVYSFTFPSLFTLEGNRIKFQTVQKFLTRKGVETIILDVVFTAASPADVFR